MKKLVLILSILSGQFVYSQGCSDAGACTIGSFTPHMDSLIMDNTKNSLRFGSSFGNADNAIAVVGSYIEYGTELTEITQLSFRLTSLLQTGNDISQWGLSDLYVTGRYRLKNGLYLTTGVKFPLMSANNTLDGLPLPMDYQSSLGTYDLILGMQYKKDNWQFVGIWQQPFIQNQNEFNPALYSEDSPLSSFVNTNGFIRSGDLILRVSYLYKISEKLAFTPSVLPIYHLGEDQFVNDLGQEQYIEGSSGLTVNLNGYLRYTLSQRQKVEFSIGFPLTVRDVRPDGTTRSFVAGLEYRVDF